MNLLNDISAATDDPKTHPWIACFIAALFFFYEFIQMNMFNALSPGLTQSFALSASELGNLSACYFYAMLISLFPAGLLLEHIPTKKLILWTMSISVIGTISFSFSHSFTTAFFSRFLSGLSGAFAFQSMLRVARDQLPISKLALANGMMISFGMLGGVVAQAPMTWLAEHLHWQQVLQVYASLGIIFLIIIAVGLPNTDLKNKKIGEGGIQKMHWIKKIKLAARNRYTWLPSLYTALFNLPVPIIGAAWGSLYLIHTRGLSPLEASTAVSLLFFGIIAGGPLFGFFSSMLQRRRLPMLLGGIAALLIILTIMYLPTLSSTSLAILFFLLGLFSSAETMGYAVITEGNPHSGSTALGMGTLVIMSTGAIAQPFFGWVVDRYSQGEFINSMPVYSLESFKTAIYMLPISFVIGLVLLAFLRETFPPCVKK